jgi:PPK2 family polyphosphate:nucleotide phosphotransferase
MSEFEKCRVKPGTTIDLTKISTDETFGWSKSAAKEQTAENLKRIEKLQELLFVEGKRGLNIVLQATDTGGKDGMVKTLSHGLNLAGSRVVSFKVPTQEEKDNGFLWRIQKQVPKASEVVIFNRSQYEDVVVARVHNLVPEATWRGRYKQINDFEAKESAPTPEMPEGTQVLKFFLHISKEEQWNRLRERFNDPAKQWKLSDADFAERPYWDDYIKAYSDALTKCSTDKAPWFIIPADNKWMRDLIITQIVADRLEGLHMQLPPPKVNIAEIGRKYFNTEPVKKAAPKGP